MKRFILLVTLLVQSALAGTPTEALGAFKKLDDWFKLRKAELKKDQG